MITFSKFTLDNGLRVIVHEDHSTPMVALNLVYDVGSRDEDPNRTGFAHLFEHLMFGGSENVEDFDTPIQNAGGENNAYTNSDLTNFYDILPAENLETALWLESDRMKKLSFNREVLDVQKKVVIEEFKENCLNQPYGDLWHHMSALAYKKHPYSWPTIGKVPQHIEDATMEDVQAFYYRFYRPNNAILSICGNVKLDEVKSLCEKWFGDIEKGDIPEKSFVLEEPQQSFREKEVKANVPSESLYLAFHMDKRLSEEYYHCDLITDVLADGRSSRLYQILVKEKQLFSSIDAYISGSFDPGLIVIEGRPMSGVDLASAELAIWEELEKLKTTEISDSELVKLKNRVESSLEFSEVNVTSKAMSLGYFELLGDAEMINQQAEKYNSITPLQIKTTSQKLFVRENCCKLIYTPK